MHQVCDLIKTLGAKQVIDIKRAHEEMLKYSRSYMTLHCMVCLLNVGFFESMDAQGKVNCADFSRQKHLEKEILAILCEYLFATRMFGRSGNDYFLTKQGAYSLTYAQGAFYFIHAYAPIFENLDALLKKQKVYGKDIFRRERSVSKASAETEKWLPFPIACDIIRKYKFKRVLDLGCGSAEFLMSLCSREKGLYACGIDVSAESIQYAQGLINKRGMDKKIRLLVGDIFKIDTIDEDLGTVDAITSMYVVHEFIGDDLTKITELFKKIRARFRGASVIICELCRQPSALIRKNASAIAEHHLFHALAKQRLLSREEWRELFKKTGYEVVEERRFDFASQCYFVLK
ncbi:MAG: class I SAM-dependent methyltransferase [Candidatus Omnitrophota bacterium]